MKRCMDDQIYIPDDCELFLIGMDFESQYRDSIESKIDALSSKSIAIDVGAHVGIWTGWLADKFTSVKAFEPDTQNFECLEENTTELSNVTLDGSALSDSAGTVNLKRDSGNSGNTCVVDESTGVTATAKTLDSIFTSSDNVDFIKLEAQGLEANVIRGAAELIGRDRPLIMLNAHNGQTFADSVAELETLGYGEVDGNVDSVNALFEHKG